MNNKIKMAAAVLTLTVATVGCGGDEESTEQTNAPVSGQTVTISAKEFAFDPSAIEVAADSQFTVEIVNVGVIEHDFVITGQESEKITTPVGQTSTGSFSLSAGTYEFYCAVAGHKESGMKGTLTVK
ncbi:MAG: cupredoxin domain-containing protein [Actinobacteria bacterium]|nr:cupredoxin domain-containing protein [Actinomycetota bacterium]